MRIVTASLTAATLLSAVLASGCKVDTEGTEGNLRFAYADPDQLFTEALDHAIAAHTRVDISLKSADGDQITQVSSAQTDQPSVAEVTGFERGTISIAAGAPGEATLSVEAGGVSDAVGLRVVEADEARVVALNDAQLAFTGGTEPLAVRRFAAGAPLVGEGRLEAVTIEPAGAGTRVEGAEHRVWIQYGAPGDISIAADGTPVRRTIVPLSAAARVELHAAPASGEPIALNSRGLVGLQAFDATDAGIAAALSVSEVTVADDAICQIRPGDYLGIEGFAIEPLAEGTCVVTVTLGSSTNELSFPIVPSNG